MLLEQILSTTRTLQGKYKFAASKCMYTFASGVIKKLSTSIVEAFRQDPSRVSRLKHWQDLITDNVYSSRLEMSSKAPLWRLPIIKAWCSS
jgi:hypothetical protein